MYKYRYHGANTATTTSTTNDNDTKSTRISKPRFTTSTSSTTTAFSHLSDNTYQLSNQLYAKYAKDSSLRQKIHNTINKWHTWRMHQGYQQLIIKLPLRPNHQCILRKNAIPTNTYSTIQPIYYTNATTIYTTANKAYLLWTVTIRIPSIRTGRMWSWRRRSKRLWKLSKQKF